MSKPLKPEEASKIHADHRPEAVIDVFNELIADNFDGVKSRVMQAEVIERLAERGVSSADAYAKHWLDVESEFRRAGWSVKYDKPGYNEDYEPYFVFSR